MYICHSQFGTLRLHNCHCRRSTALIATRSYSFTRSRSISYAHTELSPYASRSSRCVCLSALSHSRDARRDAAILTDVIRSIWPRPLQPFPRVMGPAGGDVSCAARWSHVNDPRINSHNRLMIQHWRANVDIQMIVDVEACARYMAKYASKGEPRSQPLSSIFKSSVDRLVDESDARTALRSAMVRSVGERDFSAQETAHQLLSLPLVSCTFSFVTLSLDGGRPLTKNLQSGEQVIHLSLLDHYATRSGLPDMNLMQFVSNYSVFRAEVQKRPSPVIVRAFPQYSSNPRSEQYGRY